MPSANLYRKRVSEGMSSPCANFKHKDCQQNEDCQCKCHNPAAEKSPAERAWDTRRGNGTAAETAPKRPPLRPGVKAPVTAAAQRQIKSLFSITLWGADAGAANAAPKYWTTPEDRLTDDERTALVNATYLELETHFPQLLVWMARVAESAPTANLALVVAVIAAPRLAHHNVIPESLANAIVFAPVLIAQQTAATPPESGPGQPPTADVESNGAFIPDRPDWDGEKYVSSAPTTPAPVQGNPPQQAGHGEIRHGANDQNGTGPR
jgi:hypothetical protein